MKENSLPSLNNWELKISYWYLTHKLVLRRSVVVFLVILSSIFWFYIIWQLVFYFINYTQEQGQLRQLVIQDDSGRLPVDFLRPAPLQFTNIEILQGDGNRYDFLVRASNPNNNWLAVFDYQFITPEGDSLPRRSFLLPGQSKYLMDLGLNSSQTSFTISNQKWQSVANFEQIKNNRWQFVIEGETFTPGSQTDLPSRLTFQITNRSAFSFWEVGVQAFLYSGNNLASVNYLVLDQLRSGELRPVEFFWHERLPRINRLEIIPDVNILDEDNIMPPVSPVGEYR